MGGGEERKEAIDRQDGKGKGEEIGDGRSDGRTIE